MNTLKFIVVVSIALLSADLIYHQVVNGQELNTTVCENIPDSDAMAKRNCLSTSTNQTESESPSVSKLLCGLVNDGVWYEIDGIGHCVEVS
jgi:hypothetical protein